MKSLLLMMMLYSSMASAVNQITDRSFGDEVARSKLPVVMEFYAAWCGPCKKAAPLVEEAEKRLKGKVKFVKLDVDESPHMGRMVDKLPTIAYIVPDKDIAYVTVGCPPDADAIVKMATETFKLKDR